jgi:C4-dicarboxylate-specific signal transduction histidine kinase
VSEPLPFGITRAIGPLDLTMVERMAVPEDRARINEQIAALLEGRPDRASEYHIRRAASGVARHGNSVQIRVADSGCGMEKGVLDRVFEPFFTTKGVGEGTGLGLSVVHGIVAGHGGKIEVSGEPGKGTVFTIMLPVSQPSGVAAAA